MPKRSSTRAPATYRPVVAGPLSTTVTSSLSARHDRQVHALSILKSSSLAQICVYEFSSQVWALDKLKAALHLHPNHRTYPSSGVTRQDTQGRNLREEFSQIPLSRFKHTIIQVLAIRASPGLRQVFRMSPWISKPLLHHRHLFPGQYVRPGRDGSELANLELPRQRQGNGFANYNSHSEWAIIGPESGFNEETMAGRLFDPVRSPDTPLGVFAIPRATINDRLVMVGTTPLTSQFVTTKISQYTHGWKFVKDNTMIILEQRHTPAEGANQASLEWRLHPMQFDRFKTFQDATGLDPMDAEAANPKIEILTPNYNRFEGRPIVTDRAEKNSQGHYVTLTRGLINLNAGDNLFPWGRTNYTEALGTWNPDVGREWDAPVLMERQDVD